MNLPTPIRTSLKRKIFLRFTVLVGISIAATGILSLFMLRSFVEQTMTGDISLLAEREAQTLERVANAHADTARMLALDGTIRTFLAGETAIGTLRTTLQQWGELNKDIRTIAVLTPEGMVAVATDSRIEGMDFSSLAEARRGMTTLARDPLRYLAIARTYPVATPLRKEDGALAGVLLMDFSLESLLSHASPESGMDIFLRIGEACYDLRTIVLSQRNFLLDIGPNEELSLQPPAKASLRLCDAESRSTMGMQTQNDAGEAVLIATQNVPSLGVTVIATAATERMWEPVRLLFAILAGTTGILLLLVTFVAIRLARDVVSPIAKLKKSLGKLNAGHFEHVPEVFTGDELEVLDHEVTLLAERLKSAYTSLEERVKERTRELTAAKAKDEALIESIGEGFLAIDLQGTVLAVNRTAEEMFQWDRTDILGSNFNAVLPLRKKGGKPLPPTEHIIRRALTEKATIRTSPNDTMTCQRKDGSVFPLEIIATPFLLGMEVRGVVVTIRDVTEEKRIDHMKSEFISLASHQLRTPLTAIGWYIELLQNEEAALNAEQREYVEQILQSHKRMVELVNSLLNVSRIELGHVKIEPKDTTVAELVAGPRENLTPTMEQKKIRYRERIPAITIHVDPDLAKMVLENLLSNAVKYTPTGGMIDLDVIVDEQELTFAVHDTGFGIPHAQQGRIFEKLFRADNILKTDTVGTGIGLYIAKSAVESWGGTLSFRSTEGRGSTFSFTIPRVMTTNGTETGKA